MAARRLGFRYLDTGAMYRAVALRFLEAGVTDDAEGRKHVLSGMRIDLDLEAGDPTVMLDGEDVSEQIRSPVVGAAVSRVAAMPEVRARLVEVQRGIARSFTNRGESIVVDGRDIGTNVFPEADIKIFMVADVDVRVQRRQKELEDRGIPASYDDVRAEIEARDRIDSTRSVAPLRKAADAFDVDTTGLSLDEQTDLIVQMVRERRRGTAV